MEYAVEISRFFFFGRTNCSLFCLKFKAFCYDSTLREHVNPLCYQSYKNCTHKDSQETRKKQYSNRNTLLTLAFMKEPVITSNCNSLSSFSTKRFRIIKQQVAPQGAIIKALDLFFTKMQFPFTILLALYHGLPFYSA